VIQKITTKNPENIKYINNYNTLIIDEASMINESTKMYIINTFPYHKLIFMGDINFQLDPIDGFPMTSKLLTLIEYKTNHRTQDPELLKILEHLRNCITTNKIHNIDYTLDNLNNYDYKNDIILTYTNEQKDFYTEKFKSLEKYKITKTTKEYSQGDITFVDGPDRQLQHGFTIHSVQGETFEGIIYIDRRVLMSYNLQLIYTAYSRARKLNQIKII
jgi:hypothetical protein